MSKPNGQGRLARIGKRLRPSRKSCLYYWSPPQGANFGDELSWHVVLGMIEHLGGDSSVLQACESGRRYTRRVFAIGSILHFCRAGDVVWGSGINGKVAADRYHFDGVEFCAVRGPLTRNVVQQNGGSCSEVFGDPGLLVPRLFPELLPAPGSRPEFEVSVIPNLNDERVFERDPGVDCHMISPLQDWRSVAGQIAASRFVVSSSLHGIILADALGIPCRPLISLFEAPFKYQDYFLSTQRSGVRLATSLADALTLGPIGEAQIDLDALMAAFPLETFGGPAKGT